VDLGPDAVELPFDAGRPGRGQGLNNALGRGRQHRADATPHGQAVPVQCCRPVQQKALGDSGQIPLRHGATYVLKADATGLGNRRHHHRLLSSLAQPSSQEAQDEDPLLGCQPGDQPREQVGARSRGAGAGQLAGLLHRGVELR
jgi:hypothetical protein